MKKAWTWIAIMLVLAIVIVGAKLLYDNLGGSQSALLMPQQTTPDDGEQTAEQPQGTAQTEISDQQTTPDDGGQTMEQPQGTTQTEAPDQQTQPQRQRPPDFTVYDGEGNQVKLSDMRGKPVIVNFWASWCGPCKREMPDFNAAYEKYGDDIYFMMVNMTDGQRETQESASTYVSSNGYTFPVYYDLDKSAATKYQVVTVPATYLYDADGYLVTYGIGILNADTLEEGIQLLLN